MTKFSQFLKESIAPQSFTESKESINELREFIRVNCKPFLRSKLFQMYGDGEFIYRGLVSATNEVAMIKTVRVKDETSSGRNPLNTSMKLHNAADSFFEDKFGHYYRSSSVFCTMDEEVASNYGPAYAIIPIGDFDVCQSKVVNDLTTFMRINGYMSDVFIDKLVENRTNFKKVLSIILMGLPNSEIESVTNELLKAKNHEVVDTLEIVLWAMIQDRTMVQGFTEDDVNLKFENLRRNFSTVIENCSKFSVMKELLYVLLQNCEYQENSYPLHGENEIMLKCESYLAVNSSLFSRPHYLLESFS